MKTIKRYVKTGLGIIICSAIFVGVVPYAIWLMIKDIKENGSKVFEND